MKKLLFLLYFMFSSSAFAGGGDVYLGKTWLPMFMQHKRIFTYGCRRSSSKPLNAIQFRVRNGGAVVSHLKVVYANGQREYFRLNETFENGHDSEWLELSGKERCVSRIVVLAESVDATSFPYRRSKIHFYGR